MRIATLNVNVMVLSGANFMGEPAALKCRFLFMKIIIIFIAVLICIITLLISYWFDKE